jgi:hypothetical protein
MGCAASSGEAPGNGDGKIPAGRLTLRSVQSRQRDQQDRLAASKNPKRKFMKVRSLSAALATLAVASGACAASVVGNVSAIRTHDATAQPAWAPPMYWVTLKAVTSAGKCPVFGTGEVLFVGTDMQSFALAMMAQAKGYQLAIHFDDADMVNGYCRLQYVTIGNPVTNL